MAGRGHTLRGRGLNKKEQYMSSHESKKIIIFGNWKTGTTAHMYKIKNSLPPDTRLLDEPHSYLPEPEDDSRYVLAKVISGLRLKDNKEFADYGSFMNFDKKIYIVRDPRDWIISVTLFTVHSTYGNEKNLNKIYELLHKKETSPAAVPLVEILTLLISYMNNQTLESFKDWMIHQYDWLLDFEIRLGDHCISRYEDFVSDNFTGIEEYLGMEIPGAAQVDKRHDFIVRTKSYGDWKNWFVKEDIDFFKPVFADYMYKYGYSDEWSINSPQGIDPEHCTEYVKKTVEYIKQKNMEEAKNKSYFARARNLARRIIAGS